MKKQLVFYGGAENKDAVDPVAERSLRTLLMNFIVEKRKQDAAKKK